MDFYTHSSRMKKTAKDLEIERILSELLSEVSKIELSCEIYEEELPVLKKAKLDVGFCVNELLVFLGRTPAMTLSAII